MVIQNLLTSTIPCNIQHENSTPSTLPTPTRQLHLLRPSTQHFSLSLHAPKSPWTNTTFIQAVNLLGAKSPCFRNPKPRQYQKQHTASHEHKSRLRSQVPRSSAYIVHIWRAELEEPGYKGLHHYGYGLCELAEAVGRNFGWHGPGDEDDGEVLPGYEEIALIC